MSTQPPPPANRGPEERTAIVRCRVGGSAGTLRLTEPDRTITFRGLQATWRWQVEDDGYRMWVRVINRGRHTAYLDTVDVLVASTTGFCAQFDRGVIYQNGWSSWSPTLARHLGESLYTDPGTPAYQAAHQPHWEPGDEGTISSEWVMVLTDPQRPDARALLAGFVTARDQLAEIRLRANTTELVARCYFDGALLAPGESISTETLILEVGEDPLRLLETWADKMGQEMKARLPERSVTGWCTWYYFYGENTAADVLENLAAIERHQLPLDVVLIDDGYQTAIGDWFSLDQDKFPTGMEPVARAVHDAGHRLGIWTAPFGAAADSRLFADHPDWFLRDEEGEPVVGWTHWGTDCYALDCTHPEALAWLRETFERMRTEWGVDLFKIDFLFAAARPGRRHDQRATRAQALRRGLEAIREAIGEDAFLLGCGAPLGPSVGLVDGMRVGPDVDPNWRPIWRHDLSMPATENGLRNSIARAPFHGRLWANDPDCLLVRQRGEDLGMVLNEVRTLAALVALLGGVTMDSDHLVAIRPGRLKYLRQTLPPTGVSARPLDLFENEIPRLLLLPVEREWGRWWVAGVVNWGDRTTETTVSLDELGLPPGRYHVYHYWRRRYLGITDAAVTIHRHQPHETAVLLFKPVAARPDLLTTTFHVCQGAVEVQRCTWRAAKKSLRVELHKAGRQFGELLFVTSGGWRAVQARVEGAKRPLVQAGPGIVSVGLTLTEKAVVEVEFARRIET